jgi:hypothetical protein
MTHVANVTIDSTEVAADLTDYPVYVDLSDLPASFWDTVASGGGDIRCYKSDGTTELAREVVSCEVAYQTFDGVDDYALATGISPNVANDFSITMRYRSPPLSARNWLFSLTGTGTDPVFGVKFGNAPNDDHLQVYARDDTFTEDINSANGTVTSVVAGGDNVWHTLKLESTTSAVKLYLDGVQVGSWSSISAKSYTFSQLTIGGVYRSSLAVPSNIDVQYVELAGDVQHFYGANNISGSTWTDSVGSNNGTLNGSPASPVDIQTGEVWIKVPSLSSSADTVLQVHVDGSSSDYAVTDLFGRNEVWSDYEFVSHDGGGTDSSGTLSLTANGGVTSGDTTGQIGAATNYDGANDYFTGAISSPGASDYTMQSWVSPDDSATFNPYFNVGQRDGAKPSIGIDLASSGGFNFFVQDNSSGAQFDIITGGSYSGGSSWYKHDGTLDKDGNLTVYKDGSSVQSQAVTSNSDGSIVVTDVWIGNRWNLSTYFDGQLDELRIIKAALSANWITTEYANQSDPGTFYAATDPSAGGGTNYDVSVTFGSEGGVTMTGLVGFGADFTVDMSAGIDSSALADASADFTAAAQAGAVIESRADFLVSITTGAEAGQAMTGAVTAGGTVLASLLVSAEMGATATAEAQALASMLTSAQAGQVMSGSVDGVTNIEAAMLAGYDAGASAEAQADALAALLVSYGAGLSAFEDSSIPASMVLSAAADMGMTATIGAEVSFITAAETDAVFSGQVDASAVIEVSTEAAATMIASAASSAGIEVASIANIEIFASSFSGDILTPEHRIYRVSFELRTFSVEPRVSTFTVQ